VAIGKDKAARKALLDDWDSNNALRPKPQGAGKKDAKGVLKRPVAAEEGAVEARAGVAPEYGPPPTGAVEQIRSAAGGSVVDAGSFNDGKGVKRLVLKGHREKDEGVEGRVEQQRRLEHAQQAAAEAQPIEEPGESEGMQGMPMDVGDQGR
jgi:hypothetical protein